MSYLEIHDRAGTRWLPAGPYFTIGRSLQNHIVLQGQTVSRHHARVVLQGNRALVEDLGSTYGTMVNGLYVRGWKTLTDKDRIQVGDALLIYHEGQTAPQYDSVTPPFGIPRPVPELPRNMVRCPHCGTANLKNNSVCYSCGHALLPVGFPTRPGPALRAPAAPRRAAPSRWGTALLIVLLIAVLCLLSLLVGMLLAGGPAGSWLSGRLAP